MKANIPFISLIGHEFLLNFQSYTQSLEIFGRLKNYTISDLSGYPKSFKDSLVKNDLLIHEVGNHLNFRYEKNEHISRIDGI